ncbi:flagellar basal body-associated protein FliL [Vibrio splendidus]|uniref:flagellar basal body-associated protein FliL n=1 Tax=Vibrio splendidus TaxID=29497 RepID=UPI00246960B8|nr:flagellar basal body-associated protein FliL [Vibrio splendidus]MDH5910250.1 flagellar basal body-associated protein FliL [Vibrio splendidus]MDH5943860.1 flagellar basal body-associated protein FliL [Vibrio splendidus]MDH5987483.1 flagellar basal body-associated protein FliL [Vibrio splendidus]MDH5994787.1 flagellar basal body-associated protein FliL [Vibrio splendidus]MDH6006505.1 flagellar basal body-associated protein FliL [Vibrio splendidus]
MAEEQDAPKGKSKLLIIIIAVVVLLLGVGGALLFFLGSDDSASESPSQPAIAVVAAEPVMYVNIPQPFLFNVTGDKKDRLVQIKAQMMVRGSKNEDLARYHSPLVESTLLATFASATVDQLRSPTGRVELRNKATEDIKASLTQAVGQPVIEKVLFTDFVIQ